MVLPALLLLSGGENGLLVLLAVLLVPALAGSVRVLPYAKDLASRPVAGIGGVIEKNQARQYLIWPLRTVLLDADYANVAGQELGEAAHRDRGDPQFAEPVYPVHSGLTTMMYRPEMPVTGFLALGALAALNPKTDANSGVREEIEASLHALPAPSFESIRTGDLIRVWFYPNSRTTAGVERWDGRIQRFVPI